MDLNSNNNNNNNNNSNKISNSGSRALFYSFINWQCSSVLCFTTLVVFRCRCSRRQVMCRVVSFTTLYVLFILYCVSVCLLLVAASLPACLLLCLLAWFGLVCNTMRRRPMLYVCRSVGVHCTLGACCSIVGLLAACLLRSSKKSLYSRSHIAVKMGTKEFFCRVCSTIHRVRHHHHIFFLFTFVFHHFYINFYNFFEL